MFSQQKQPIVRFLWCRFCPSPLLHHFTHKLQPLWQGNYLLFLPRALVFDYDKRHKSKKERTQAGKKRRGDNKKSPGEVRGLWLCFCSREARPPMASDKWTQRWHGSSRVCGLIGRLPLGEGRRLAVRLCSWGQSGQRQATRSHRVG